MANPESGDWKTIKRLGRYLKAESRLVQEFKFQDIPTKVVAWTDTDHAGCLETRKSTNGGAIQVGSHNIKTWSTTQTVVALSSGEAEYYGLVKAASQAMGVRNLLRDMGVEMGIEIRTDASVAKSIAMRRGAGKVRHIEVNQLWVQEKVAKGEIEIRKVGTEANVADILTKHVEREKLDRHLATMGYLREQGHNDITLRSTWRAT